jgi:hypothetical protein
MARTCRLLAIGLVLAGWSACKMPDELPGELVGAYRIDGALLENSCGSSAVPAADPLRFNVEIRKQNGSGFWLVSSPPGHLGSLADDGDFSFQNQATYDVGPEARRPVELLVEMDIERLADPEAARQQGEDRTQPCRLAVTERIAGTLLRDNLADHDGGADSSAAEREDDGREGSADLIGDNEIAIRVAGGDCRASLADNGGPFEQLPCEVRYELEGELITP